MGRGKDNDIFTKKSQVVYSSKKNILKINSYIGR